ncbi:MAG: thiamine phosphate synthase [Kiritimatiellae bacterium]|nr:thiamine phosphate synthase [Kiritimatiellia bacterium]
MKRTLAERIEMFNSSDIYPVVSSNFCNGRDVTDVVASIARGGAKIVQLREKTCSDHQLFELTKQCKMITDEYNMLLIVDDRLDIALAAGADGVHLGQDDLPISVARNLAPELLLGASTHNKNEILEAMDAGCSYLNMGPMFPTKTKSVQCGALGLEFIEELKGYVKCPFSVMGGIKGEHIPLLSSKGYKHIAMVTEITQAVNIEEKVKQLRYIMSDAT